MKNDSAPHLVSTAKLKKLFFSSQNSECSTWRSMETELNFWSSDFPWKRRKTRKTAAPQCGGRGLRSHGAREGARHPSVEEGICDPTAQEKGRNTHLSFSPGHGKNEKEFHTRCVCTGGWRMKVLFLQFRFFVYLDCDAIERNCLYFSLH